MARFLPNHRIRATGRAFDAVASTDAFAMQQAMNDVKVAMSEMGAVAAPTVAGLARGVPSAASAFGELPGPAQNAIVAVGGMVAIGGPVLSTVGRMTTNIGGLVTSFRKMGTASQVAAGGFLGGVDVGHHSIPSRSTRSRS